MFNERERERERCIQDHEKQVLSFPRQDKIVHFTEDFDTEDIETELGYDNYMSYRGVSNIISLNLTYSKFVKYVKNTNYMGNLSSESL